MNAKQFNPEYDFEIVGATYIESPQPNSVLFVGKKIASHIVHLEKAHQCLVFVEDGIDVPVQFQKDNCIKFSPNPSRDYAMTAKIIWEERQNICQRKIYTMAKAGYWLGENARIGKDVNIQPGAFIDHDVVIGDGATILSGARISNATLGSGCIIKQNAVVGGYGFVMSRDEMNQIVRIPSLGCVVLGSEVEVGSFTTVCCGTGNDTILEDRVKLDDHVHIGHDVHIAHDTEVTAGVIVGGYCRIGENCFIGINSSLRNRISIGANVFVGMGAVVTKSFQDGITIIGNPARIKE